MASGYSSPYFTFKGNAIAKRDFDEHFAIDLLVKDQTLMLQQARGAEGPDARARGRARGVPVRSGPGPRPRGHLRRGEGARARRRRDGVAVRAARVSRCGDRLLDGSPPHLDALGASGSATPTRTRQAIPPAAYAACGLRRSQAKPMNAASTTAVAIIAFTTFDSPKPYECRPGREHEVHAEVGHQDRLERDDAPGRDAEAAEQPLGPRVDDRHVGEERHERPDLLRVPAPVAAPRRGGPHRAGHDAGDQQDRADHRVPVEQVRHQQRRAATRRGERLEAELHVRDHDAEREHRVADHDDRHVHREPERAGQHRRHRVDERVDRQQVRERHRQRGHRGGVQDHDPVAQGDRGHEREGADTPGQEQQRLVHVRGGNPSGDRPARPDAPAHDGETRERAPRRRRGPSRAAEHSRPRSRAAATASARSRRFASAAPGCT